MPERTPKSGLPSDAECYQCGTIFTFVRCVGRRAPVCCSDDCRRERRSAVARQHRQRLRGIRTCRHCGRRVPSLRSWYCSAECMAIVHRGRDLAQAKARYHSLRGQSVPVFYGDCEECGNCFCYRRRGRGRFCSRRCSATVRKRRRDRVKRAGDSIGLHALGDRDGWRCHLCGGGVPKGRRFAFRKTDATVDHLVPLSAGGQHTWDNVALAHHHCNVSRQADGAAQLRLIA